ncbi:MAG: DUF1343 domain-containing protein [Veillonellaceae bacterium]|jgi:uncharacterized protein YbbC (DUF1343 family)|nr:DUF1343 domain-containing protein [Veillonellaceae bacterium]
MVRAIILLCIAVFGFCFIPQTGYANAADAKNEAVRLGIDNIDDYLHIFAGKKVGLITNATGINSKFESSVDILYSKTNLVALFSPEHGIRGAAKAGDKVGNIIDAKTGLPVHSLYGATKKPTPEMISGLDILAFDIQDVGARPYTYIYTMAYAMQSAKEQGKTFVVFDRPNPIGGVEVEGGLIKPGYESFIGMYPIPSRHGMTVGELAQFFNSEFGIGCELIVIKMTGWQRNMYYFDTGLPWVMTSPNIPTPETALVYPGTGIFGGTNVSEGVGTTRPFEFVGAPWLNGEFLAWRLNRMELPGVIFRPAYFTPQFGLYKGEQCAGIQLHITDSNAFRPVKTAMLILDQVKDLGGDNFRFKRPNGTDRSLDLIVGDDRLRTGRATVAELLGEWAVEADSFKAKAQKYYLYE